MLGRTSEMKTITNVCSRPSMTFFYIGKLSVCTLLKRSSESDIAAVVYAA